MTACQQALISGGGPTVSLPAALSPTSTVAAGTATCQFELTNGGDIRMTTVNNTVNDVGDWITPKNSFSLFEVMLTVNSGTSPSGSAVGSWLNLGTTRNWQISQAVLGINSNNCTVQIRRASSGVVMATSAVNMTAERT